MPATRQVHFVNYPLQYNLLKKEIDAAISKVLTQGDLILREDVELFENHLSRIIGAKYVVAVNSGTDALIFALLANGVGKGDEVITVSHTFFATIEAIVHTGATPVLIDVSDDFLMDVSQLERAITKKTKAILPVHLNGRVCQMDTIMSIARKRNLLVIEDAAQALGATFKDKGAGSFGSAGTFSFYPAKLLGSAGDGGAVATNSKRVAEKISLLRNHGQKTRTNIVSYGFTSRLHNIQAAILNAKVPHLKSWTTRRRRIARMYHKGLSDVAPIVLPPYDGGGRYDVFQNYVLRARKRDKLFDYLKKRGVETLIKDPVPLHHHKAIGLSRFHLPVSERLAKEVISLPMYPELTDKDINYVIRAVREFYT